MDWNIIKRLMNCFRCSFINQSGYFIAHKVANECFMIDDCKTELDVQCKVLEWLSRGACKSQPYRSKTTNDNLHRFMLVGINQFLGTSFTQEDMMEIYTYLGNKCNHAKTIKFIQSGYDMSLLI